LSIGILNKNKKNNWWFSPPIITQIRERVAVFLVGNIIEKLSVVATVTTSHIICGFLSHMGAPHTSIFCGGFRTLKTSPISNHGTVSRTGKSSNHSQSSSSQGALPKPSKWQRGYSSPSSCQ